LIKIKLMEDSLVLGIETSCDETAAAVVKGGHQVLSNVVASQVEFHKKFGGVVPEIASRKHVETVNLVIQEALERAEVEFKDLAAVAVTMGPGLIGALLVGVVTAQAIAYAWQLPLIGVQHLVSHLWANFLAHQELDFPFVALVASGGHTCLIYAESVDSLQLIGETLDDAAGEAFDKVAKFLELGYPGGPIIDKLARKGNPQAVNFPRAMMESGDYNFSLSGLKTAVVNYVKREGKERLQIADICASFQEALLEVLVAKTVGAAREMGVKQIAIAGGVAANSRLREWLAEASQKVGLKFFSPPLELCTDNAAMVAAAAFPKLAKGDFLSFNVAPQANLPISY
jgi:N6-L-threonylcarbamoyladenine synthase